MSEQPTDPFRALGEVVRTPALRAAALEVVAWYLLGWTPLVGCLLGDERAGLTWIGACLPVVLVSYPIARLQVRVIAQRTGHSGSLGLGSFLALVLGGLLPAFGAGLVFGIASAILVATLAFLSELDGGHAPPNAAAVIIGMAASCLSTAVVLEFRTLALLGIAEDRPWFGDALSGSWRGALPTGRSLQWILAALLVVGLVGTWLFDLERMVNLEGLRWRPLGTLTFLAIVSSLASVAWPVYVAATRPAPPVPGAAA